MIKLKNKHKIYFVLLLIFSSSIACTFPRFLQYLTVSVVSVKTVYTLYQTHCDYISMTKLAVFPGY